MDASQRPGSTTATYDRLTTSMVVEVGDVLARHGYPLDGRGLTELRQHLAHLLYGGECTGSSR